jgi:DNA-binding NarL/FixJ family response regulator
MTRILIADDRESMRIAIRALIRMRPDWQICGEANDGRDVVVKAAELQPDLVVLDFKMPVANGIQAGSEIFRSSPTLPVVMYTLYRTPEIEAAAKRAGIRQVIAKEDGGKHLLSAIETELLANNSRVPQ